MPRSHEPRPRASISMPTLPIPVLVSSDGTSAVSLLAVRMDSDSMMSPPFAMSCGGVWTEEESTEFVRG